MATTTGAFSYLLAPGLRKVFTDEHKKWPEEYSQIASIYSSKKAYEDELVTAGLGRFQRKNQGKSLIYDDPIQADYKRYTHAAYALGFRVTREMWDDDLYGVMKKMSKQLAQSARQSVELEFGGLIDDAFVGGAYTGQDGKALCALDHVLTVGGSYANEPANQADLGIGSLRSAMERMEKCVNERGLPIHIQPKVLIVDPSFQWIADEIIGTKGAKPYTPDNTINAFDKFGLSYMVYHFQADSDQWLLLADKSVHDIHFFWRTKIMFENGDDFDTKDAKFSGFMRFSFGFTDWRGVDGSTGA